ncbi:unnamed protein product [Ilex paraguariensis]|uniref:Tryptophan synthase n=1 Tax=Ilex paraguariensis TaxID=185542 RepID=A0ABC8UCT1_9AQUA
MAGGGDNNNNTTFMMVRIALKKQTAYTRRLEYPGVSPELSFLKDIGRADFYTVTDQEALDAYERLCRLEGIFPALEASHALAFLEKLCPTLPNGAKVVVNCSGRGDKDAATVFKHIHDSPINKDKCSLQ